MSKFIVCLLIAISLATSLSKKKEIETDSSDTEATEPTFTTTEITGPNGMESTDTSLNETVITGPNGTESTDTSLNDTVVMGPSGTESTDTSLNDTVVMGPNGTESTDTSLNGTVVMGPNGTESTDTSLNDTEVTESSSMEYIETNVTDTDHTFNKTQTTEAPSEKTTPQILPTPTTQPATTKFPAPMDPELGDETTNFPLKIKFESNFTEELEDSSSALYNETRKEVVETLEPAFRETPGFKEVVVTGFKRGSIIALFDVVYFLKSALVETAELKREMTDTLRSLANERVGGARVNQEYLSDVVIEELVAQAFSEVDKLRKNLCDMTLAKPLCDNAFTCITCNIGEQGCRMGAHCIHKCEEHTCDPKTSICYLDIHFKPKCKCKHGYITFGDDCIDLWVIVAIGSACCCFFLFLFIVTVIAICCRKKKTKGELNIQHSEDGVEIDGIMEPSLPRSKIRGSGNRSSPTPLRKMTDPNEELNLYYSVPEEDYSRPWSADDLQWASKHEYDNKGYDNGHRYKRKSDPGGNIYGPDPTLMEIQHTDAYRNFQPSVMHVDPSADYSIKRPSFLTASVNGIDKSPKDPRSHDVTTKF